MEMFEIDVGRKKISISRAEFRLRDMKFVEDMGAELYADGDVGIMLMFFPVSD